MSTTTTARKPLIDNTIENTDTQDLSISGHTISLTNGGSVTVPDNYRSISDSTSSTSTDVSASSKAVKTAYDKGDHSHPYASTSHTHDYLPLSGGVTTDVVTQELGGVAWSHNEATHRPVSKKLISEVPHTGTTGINIQDVHGEADVTGIINGVTFTYLAAWTAVEAEGGRLPTLAELQDEVGAGSGQGYDGEVLWTCTPAGPHHVWAFIGRISSYPDNVPIRVDITDDDNVYSTRCFWDVSRKGKQANYDHSGVLNADTVDGFSVGKSVPSNAVFTDTTTAPTWSEVTSKPTTFAPTSHTHDYVPLSDGVATDLQVNGKFKLESNIYAMRHRNYVVNSSTPKEILDEDGSVLETGGAYRVVSHIDGTGTDQSSSAIFWNQNGTWKVNVTAQSGTGSNHQQFHINSAGKPAIKTWHTSNYTVQVFCERMNLNENTGTDNTSHYFGADAFMSNIAGSLVFNNNGNTNKIFHSGNDGAGSGLDADTVAGFTVGKSVPSTAVFTDNNTTYSNFSGTTAGLVPTSTSDDDTKFLRADGTWVVPTDTNTDTVYSLPASVIHDTNLLSPHLPFTVGSGNDPWWGSNNADESFREVHDTPFARGVVWVARNLSTENGADGGWNSQRIAIDPNKRYRYSVYAKQSSHNGTLYWGTHGYGGSQGTLNELSGSKNSNPYAFATDLPTTNTWYLIVGYVFESGYTSTDKHPDHGVWDLSTGSKVSNSGSDYKWHPENNEANTRAYQYYNDTPTADEYHFWQPRYEEVNGEEPSIRELCGFPDTTSYLPLTGGTLTGGVTLKHNDGLFVKSESNNPTDGARIRFSDQTSDWSQYGTIKYKHADNTVSSGSNDGFIFEGSQAKTIFRFNGIVNVNGTDVIGTDANIDGGRIKGTVPDADKLDGMDTTASGNRWGVIPTVASDGVMEVGKYIDFHQTDADTGDLNPRLTATATGGLECNKSFKCTDITATGTITSGVGVDGVIMHWDDSGYLRRMTTQGGVIMSADSSLVLHAGDHHANYEADLGITNTQTVETAYVTADGEVQIISGYQEGIDSAKRFKFKNTGNLEVSADVIAYYSDDRLKTRIGNIESPLHKVQSLSGFIYVENELANSVGYNNPDTQVGVSAQEVKEVLPEAVTIAPFDRDDLGKSKSGEDYLTVDYAKMVPLLIEAIKELSAKVKELENK